MTSLPASILSIRRSLGSSLAIALLGASATAHAQLPSVVELGVRTCDSEEAARVEELVRVEMRADGIEEVRAISETDTPALARIAVEPADCAGEPGAYRIAIDDVATRKRVERSVSLADVDADARPRALALAIAELLRASWAELAYVEPPPAIPRRIVETVRLRDPPSEDARELTVPDEAPIEAPPRETPRVLIDTGALVRAFPGARSALLGGRLAASIAIVPRLRLEIGGEGGAGQSLDRLGRVDLWYAAGALALGVDLDVHPVLFVASVRAALGYGGASGDAYDPSTRIGDGGAFVMFVGASLLGYLEIAAPLRAVFGIEVGGTAVGIDAIADDTAIAGIRGPMFAASLGIALSL